MLVCGGRATRGKFRTRELRQMLCDGAVAMLYVMLYVMLLAGHLRARRQRSARPSSANEASTWVL